MEHYHRDCKWYIIVGTTSGTLSYGLHVVHYHMDYKWYIIIETTSGIIIGATSGTLS